MKLTAVDRLVLWLWPERGIRRLAARRALEEMLATPHPGEGDSKQTDASRARPRQQEWEAAGRLTADGEFQVFRDSGYEILRRKERR